MHRQPPCWVHCAWDPGCSEQTEGHWSNRPRKPSSGHAEIHAAPKVHSLLLEGCAFSFLGGAHPVIQPLYRQLGRYVVITSLPLLGWRNCFRKQSLVFISNLDTAATKFGSPGDSSVARLSHVLLHPGHASQVLGLLRFANRDRWPFTYVGRWSFVLYRIVTAQAMDLRGFLVAQVGRRPTLPPAVRRSR